MSRRIGQGVDPPHAIGLLDQVFRVLAPAGISKLLHPDEVGNRHAEMGDGGQFGKAASGLAEAFDQGLSAAAWKYHDVGAGRDQQRIVLRRARQVGVEMGADAVRNAGVGRI